MPQDALSYHHRLYTSLATPREREESTPDSLLQLLSYSLPSVKSPNITP